MLARYWFAAEACVKRKHWNIAPQAPEEFRQALGQEGIHPILAQVFYGRSYTHPAAALHSFGTYAHTEDPFAIKGMDVAVDRLMRADGNGERIAVYGDFDCDGV